MGNMFNNNQFNIFHKLLRLLFNNNLLFKKSFKNNQLFRKLFNNQLFKLHRLYNKSSNNLKFNMELLKETQLSAQFKLKELPIKSNKVDQELNMFHSKKLSPPMIPSTKLIIFHM